MKMMKVNLGPGHNELPRVMGLTLCSAMSDESFTFHTLLLLMTRAAQLKRIFLRFRKVVHREKLNMLCCAILGKCWYRN